MGKYCGSWKIDDILYHKIQTSSVTTGAATDADAAPTWRVYEDSTATPVTTGSYSTLNAMTGFYTAALTLAAAIGYEKGKTYSIRYQATVASIIGADVDMFQIEAEVDANAVSITANAHVASVSAGAIAAASIADGAFTAAKFGAGFITAGSFSGNAISGMAVTVGATAQAAIVDLVWDEPKVGHTTADTYGEYLDATVSGIGAAGAVTVGATAVSAIAAAVWDKTAAAHVGAGSFGEIVNDTQSLGAIVNGIWDEPKANHTTADTFGEFLDATVSGIGAAGAVTIGATSVAVIVDAVWDETGSDHTSAGSFGARLNVSVNSMTSGAIGAVTVGATSVAVIIDAVWDETGSDHTSAGSFGARLNVSVNSMTSGAIGAVTVGATAASAIAVATQALAMTLGSTAVAAVQLGLASQTSVDDLPTNAELATALGTADDAVLAAIAALNNISVANILAATVEGSTTLVQTLRLLNAALGGKASGLETTEATYRDIGDTKNRIVATVDADGNRTAVTLDLS